MKILRYRKLGRHIATDPDTTRRIQELIAAWELEIDEKGPAPSHHAVIGVRSAPTHGRSLDIRFGSGRQLRESYYLNE